MALEKVNSGIEQMTGILGLLNKYYIAPAAVFGGTVVAGTVAGSATGHALFQHWGLTKYEAVKPTTDDLIEHILEVVQNDPLGILFGGMCGALTGITLGRTLAGRIEPE